MKQPRTSAQRANRGSKPEHKIKVRSASFASPVEYKIATDEQINLTKTEAFRFLEMQTFDGERKVRDLHVQYLMDEWNGGRFLWHHVMLGIAVLDGVNYRINGQHTCWMRVNIPQASEPVKATVRCITYKVQSSEQLRSLYSVFDRNAPRNASHIAKVMLGDTPAGRSIPRGYIGQLVGGFRLFFSEREDNRMSIDEMVGMISKNYEALFSVVGQYYTTHYSDHEFIRRQAVIAAMFSTFSKAVQKSEEFWSPVFNGIALTTKTDARYQLRNYLLTHGHSTKRGDLEKVSKEDAYRTCVNAWNKYRAGEAVSILRTTDKRPVVSE